MLMRKGKREKILLVEVGAKVTPYPPLGVMLLAAVIRDKHDVVIKDYSGKKLDERKIEQEIKHIDPFIVGLRVLTGPSIPRALLISKIAKKLRKIVIWGGPHPTILPYQTLENENIDAVCIGEGENTLQDLIKYFQDREERKNKKIKKVLGAGVKEKGKIKIYPPQKKFVDFKKLPLPAWDLLEDINRYFPERGHNVLPVSTTRGCIFKCGFCHNSNENVKCYLGPYRIAEPQRAIDEFKLVQSLVKNKIDYLDVGEDLHLISYDYAENFCMAIKNSGIRGLKWNTSTRYAILNERIINLIAKHNCKRVLLGVESGSERIQKMNGKIVRLGHAIKMAQLLRKKKIFVTNAYIFGHPTESIEELKTTLKFIKKIPADENLIQLYRPMPGTPYFQLCIKEGKISEIPKKLEHWSGFGVLRHDINVSRIPSDILFSAYYKTNLFEQTKYIFNQQRYYLRENMYYKFFKNFINNRFTFKLKEYIAS